MQFSTVRAFAPGRVNLIGDHTDYNSGVALPMAIDLGTTVTYTTDGGERVRMSSDIAWEAGSADIDLHVALDPYVIGQLEPRWSRLVAALVALVRPAGGSGTVSSTVPIGSGLSSSASLEVAIALTFGLEGAPHTIASTCQLAEQTATGVPSGLMDQLTVAGGVDGCALLIDFEDLSLTPVELPPQMEVIVAHSGVRRSLDRTPYTERRSECEAASYRLGDLGRVDLSTVMSLPDPLLRKRARHVVTECERVMQFVAALRSGDLVAAGAIMTESHRSLAIDFEVSTPELDLLADKLRDIPGVFGARLTGAGFGGCVVAISEPGAVDPSTLGVDAWRVKPSGGARIVGTR